MCTESIKYYPKSEIVDSLKIFLEQLDLLVKIEVKKSLILIISDSGVQTKM